MPKGLAVFVVVAMAAGIVVLWRPATANPAAPAARHPTTRVCPDKGKLLACFAIRQTDAVVSNLAANALPDGFGPADLRSAYGLTTTGSAAMTVATSTLTTTRTPNPTSPPTGRPSACPPARKTIHTRACLPDLGVQVR